jgi:hypothetical protein
VGIWKCGFGDLAKSLKLANMRSGHLEMWVRRSGQVTQARKYAERAIRDALKIGDDYFRPEIKMRWREIREEFEREREELVRATLADVDRIFAAQEGQVEAYLDWYYSLGGECSRLAKLLVGQLEKYMEDQLREKLRLGELERQYGDIITEATRKMEGIVKKADANVYEMKSFYKLGDNELKNYKLHVVETLPSLEELPGFREIESFKKRLLWGTGIVGFAAVVETGYIVKRMVSKAVGKNLVKASAVAVIKALASQGIKVGAGAAGFLAGARWARLQER